MAFKNSRKKTIRPAEAARILSLSETAVLELVHSGQIKAIRNGRAILIPRKEVNRWVEEKLNEESPAPRDEKEENPLQDPTLTAERLILEAGRRFKSNGVLEQLIEEAGREIGYEAKILAEAGREIESEDEDREFFIEAKLALAEKYAKLLAKEMIGRPLSAKEMRFLEVMRRRRS